MNGKVVPFTESRLFRENCDNVRAVIDIPPLQPERLMVFNEVMKRRQTFEEALNPAPDDPNKLNLIPRQRLSLFRDALYKAIENAFSQENLNE